MENCIADQVDASLLAALATAAQRNVGDFDQLELAAAAWALTESGVSVLRELQLEQDCKMKLILTSNNFELSENLAKHA